MSESSGSSWPYNYTEPRCQNGHLTMLWSWHGAASVTGGSVSQTIESTVACRAWKSQLFFFKWHFHAHQIHTHHFNLKATTNYHIQPLRSHTLPEVTWQLQPETSFVPKAGNKQVKTISHDESWSFFKLEFQTSPLLHPFQWDGIVPIRWEGFPVCNAQLSFFLKQSCS